MTLPTSACHSTVPRELRDFPAPDQAIDQAIRLHEFFPPSNTGCYHVSEADLTNWAGPSPSGTEQPTWPRTGEPGAPSIPPRTSPDPCRPSQGVVPCQSQMTV